MPQSRDREYEYRYIKRNWNKMALFEIKNDKSVKVSICSRCLEYRKI